MHCSIGAAMWAAISCGCATAMPLEKEYLGMAYDWDRQWPDESMRISRNFWKQTNYISKRSSNETKHNKKNNFPVICGIMLKVFLPPNQGDLGESWYGPLQLTLLWILQGLLGYHSWWLFPSPNFTEKNSGDHCDCGAFFSTFLFGRAWRCENGETSQFSWWSCCFGGWRDTEIERVLMGVSQQNCQWKECGKDSLATELDWHDSVSYGTFDQVRGCWWKKHSNSMDVYNLSY